MNDNLSKKQEIELENKQLRDENERLKQRLVDMSDFEDFVAQITQISDEERKLKETMRFITEYLSSYVRNLKNRFTDEMNRITSSSSTNLNVTGITVGQRNIGINADFEKNVINVGLTQQPSTFSKIDVLTWDGKAYISKETGEKLSPELLNSYIVKLLPE